jgi:2-C-methyl-D-erythritol 2,4-cyclodiphosphate synthase
MDALLGAAALGDIGVLFPPEDPDFKDADSASLSNEVARRLLTAGYEIVNLDLTLLSETPKIRPHHAAMRAAIAQAFDIDASKIGLKATTLEKLGALGRGEGIACDAVALIREVGSE